MSVKTALFILFLVESIFFKVIIVSADDVENKVVDEQGISTPSIHLAVKAQQLSGIETLILQPANYQAEFSAYGSALNIQSLVNLHHRYQLARTERTSAKAKYLNSEQNINRQQNLFRHGVSSKRSLQGQQLQWRVDKATVDAAHVQGKAIVDEAILTWGKELTQWALSDNAEQLSFFLSGQQTLLKIVLPVNKQLANGIQTIVVEPSGNRSKAGEASLIAVAPHIDNKNQGESYFFKTDDPAIKVGMRVAAWIPEQNESRKGVIIPKSAVIWHLDQSFVYIKTDSHTFSRRQIDHYSVMPNGYFISNELKPGEQLVITGGQLLLSEEFRAQIPHEDND